jgi:hypothetical protein
VEQESDSLMHLICIAFIVFFTVFIIAWLHATVKVGPPGDFFLQLGELVQSTVRTIFV